MESKKKNFKYELELTRRELFNDFLEFYENNNLGIERTYPKDMQEIKNNVHFKIENNAENVGLLLTRGKNGNGHYKEKLIIMAKDYQRDSDLINKIIKEFE